MSLLVCYPGRTVEGLRVQLKEDFAARREVLNAAATESRRTSPPEQEVQRGAITRPPQQLSKQHAGEINTLHNSVTVRNQIKATESISKCDNGSRCTLEWKWKSPDGRTHTVGKLAYSISLK